MNEPLVRPATLAAGLSLALLLGLYLLVTSTVTFTERFWVYDIKRMLELCAFPLIFATVLLNAPLRDAFRNLLCRIPRWMGAALIGIVGLGIVSSIYNNHSTMALLYSLAEVSMLSLLVIAMLCVAACRQVAGRRFDQTVVVLLAMTGLAVGLQELLGVLAAWSAGMEFHPRIALLHFSWPRFYNDVQAWSIPVITALPLILPGKSLAKVLCVAALVLEWYVLIATGARGAMLGVALAVSAAILFLPKVRRILLGYQFAGLIGGILVYGLVVVGHQHLVGGTAEAAAEIIIEDGTEAARSKDLSAEAQADVQAHTQAQIQAQIQAIGDSSGKFLEPVTGTRMWTSSGRMDMWRGSLLDTKAHPLLGIGPMNYACLGPVNRAGHPHNFPLQFMSEWGLPAFALLASVLAFLFFRLAHALRLPVNPEHTDLTLAGLFATGVLAAAINACFSGVFMGPASQVAGVLVAGCLLGLMPVTAYAVPARHARPLILATALCVSLAFLILAAKELKVSEVRFEQTPLMDRGIPRLWQNGKVCALYQEQQNRGSKP